MEDLWGIYSKHNSSLTTWYLSYTDVNTTGETHQGQAVLDVVESVITRMKLLCGMAASSGGMPEGRVGG